MEKNKTAIEWLWEELPKFLPNNISITEVVELASLFDQVKEMEKEQIMTAWESGFTAHKIDEKYGIDKTEFSSDKYYDNNYKQ
jgi:hypothetical protein